MSISVVKRVAMVLLFLACLMACWAWWPDSKLARVRAMRDELFGQSGKALSKEERTAKFAIFREEENKLTDAQRRSLFDDRRKRRQAELTRYFSLSSEEKTKFLDERIQAMETRRQEMQGVGQGPVAAGGPFGASGFGPLASRGGGQSLQERDQRRMAWLDSMTAEERGQMYQFRAVMAARRAQLGLPALGPRSMP